MHKTQHLETFWLTFPRDASLPLGIGGTAFSEEDAFGLIRAQGINAWFSRAAEVKVVNRGVRINDLHQRHVVMNSGPMQFRGVWYPACNIGWGAPRDRAFWPFSDATGL